MLIARTITDGVIWALAATVLPFAYVWLLAALLISVGVISGSGRLARITCLDRTWARRFITVGPRTRSPVVLASAICLAFAMAVFFVACDFLLIGLSIA